MIKDTDGSIHCHVKMLHIVFSFFNAPKEVYSRRIYLYKKWTFLYV